ncbi:MAG: serine hydrolase [Clostridia bacterium]|nr:serine hydrolase [Clostridia bacterium]
MIDRLVQELQAAGANIYRVGVCRNGEYLSRDVQPSSACHNIYSISKNVTATAVAIACSKGMIDLDASVIRYLGTYLPDHYDPRYADVKVRHLLTQTTGIAKGSLFEDDRYLGTDRNWITRVLSRPLEFAAGEHFTYDNGNFYLLACIVELVSKMSVLEFLEENLFGEMDVHEYAWERCPLGHCMGATGLYMRMEDLCKLGMLYLLDGVWHGKKLLPEGWAEQSTRPYSTFEDGTGYGMSFWTYPDGDFHLSGAHGQEVYVARQKGIVVGVQGFTQGPNVAEIIRKCL